MTKKQIKEKLKSQKGITGADVLIALLLILTLIGIIGMIYLNLKTLARMTYAKSGATRIATNIIENAKGEFFDKVQNYDSSSAGAQPKVLNTKIPKGYVVIISTENIEDDENHIVKKVNVTVKYNKNNDNNVVELSTVIEREKVRECNSPNFSGEYVEKLVGPNSQYQIFDNINNIDEDKKIICPIKYNGENYVIIQGYDINRMWYSYSDKQWARALVFDNLSELEDYIDTSNNTVQNLEILKDDDKSFVWIPRYKIDENVSPNKVYFMYKDKNYPILKQTGNSEYNYINLSNEDFNFSLKIVFTETTNEEMVLGEWVKYYYIKNLSSNERVKKLYDSEYGPLFEFK